MKASNDILSLKWPQKKILIIYPSEFYTMPNSGLDIVGRKKRKIV
jgi:hypothetical protein